MPLPHDLKRFKADDYEQEDAFQIMTPSDAGFALACILAYALIFWTYFK